MVRLVEQAQDCGYGESYEPIDVDALFDEPTVSLRGPWNPTDLIEIGPTADDLPGLYEYHLDFPGNALDPGCDYERWAMRVTEGTAPTVYAHVATDPDHPGATRPAVLALLRLQRLEQHPRGRLGEHPARLRCRRRASGARDASRCPSATASTRGPRRRRGATTSSSSSTARIRSCTRRPARTRTSSSRRSSSAARPSRASAATTRRARASTFAPSCERFRAIRPRPAPGFRGLRSRGAGASCSGRSSTAPPAPT